MKLKVKVGRVLQYAAKARPENTFGEPTHWEVLLFTEPHIGDIVLHTETTQGTPQGKEFAAWAATLKCNDVVELDMNLTPSSNG